MSIIVIMTVNCPIHTGVGLVVPKPSHPATHSFSYEQVQALLYTLAADDWEDGPRCLLDVLAETEKGE